MNSLSTMSEILQDPFAIAIVACISAYLLGAVPFGYVIAKLFLGFDIRTRGSGNIGMTNMIRTGGKVPGIVTFLLDFAKGTAGIAVAKLLDAPEPVVLLAGLSAVFGHTRSIFLQFKGGKGVATLLGVLLAVDYALLLIFAACWLCMFFWKSISSLSALVALAVLPISALILYGIHAMFFFCLAVSLYIVALHHENIARLLKKREGRLESSDSTN